MKLQVAVVRINRGIDEIKKRLEVLALKKSFVKAGVMSGTHKTEPGAHAAHATDKKRDVNGRFRKSTVERAGSLTNAQLASIHEFGLSNAPARPFVRPPFVKHREEYLEILRAGYRQALEKGDADGYRRTLALVGQKMAADIKKYVTEGNNLAPNAASTIARKGSSRPLVDTGQLINSVNYEVVENGSSHEH